MDALAVSKKGLEDEDKLGIFEKFAAKNLNLFGKQLEIVENFSKHAPRIAWRFIYFIPEFLLFYYSYGVIQQLSKNFRESQTLNSIESFFTNTENLLPLFWWILAYLILIAARYIIRVIFERLSIKFKEEFEVFIDDLIENTFSFLKTFYWITTRKPQKHYLDSIVLEYDRFLMPGSYRASFFTLRDVCVNLNVAIRGQSKNSDSFFHSPVEGIGGEGSIWGFLIAGKSKRNFRNLILVGDAGSGKSTLLKSVAVAYAEGHYKRNKESRKAPKLVPIVLVATEVVDSIVNADISLCQAAAHNFRLSKISKHKEFNNWINSQIKRSKCLVLIDGIDEISDINHRKKFNEWINRTVRKNPGNYFIVSTRPAGYDNSILKNFVVLEVRDLSLDGVERFIANYYLNEDLNLQNIQVVARQRTAKRLGKPFFLSFRSLKDSHYLAAQKKTGHLAGTLITKIMSTPALTKMAVNPLSLSMMVAIHSEKYPLPASRPKLYEELCRTLLSPKPNLNITTPKTERNEDSLTQDYQILLLKELALNLMKNGKLEFSTAEATAYLSSHIRNWTGNSAEKSKDLAKKFLENIQYRIEFRVVYCKSP